MCFCCCTTRKSILIYLIIITSFAFIYGIVALSQFGSSSDIYDILIKRLELLESMPSTSNSGIPSYGTYRRMQFYPGYYPTYIDSLTGDAKSASIIIGLTKDSIENKGYGMVKSLKGIENGLGVLIFVFTIIFLGAEIVYLFFIRGIKEFQLMETKIYNIFNIIRIVVYALAIAFIFLSILYSCLLIGALAQYISLINNLDSCASGMVVGMVYGYYSFWFFITLSCGFSKERSLFIAVGSEQNPGAEAKYDVNGNAIVRAIISVQPVVGTNLQYDMKPPNLPYQQVPNYYPQPQQNIATNQIPQPQIQQQIQDKTVDPNSGRNLNENQVNNVNNQ